MRGCNRTRRRRRRRRCTEAEMAPDRCSLPAPESPRHHHPSSLLLPLPFHGTPSLPCVRGRILRWCNGVCYVRFRWRGRLGLRFRSSAMVRCLRCSPARCLYRPGKPMIGRQLCHLASGPQSIETSAPAGASWCRLATSASHLRTPNLGPTVALISSTILLPSVDMFLCCLFAAARLLTRLDTSVAL